MKPKNLTHHRVNTIPYFAHPKKGLVFLFERKDPKFKAPFQEGGFNGIGGNFFGDMKHLSPQETIGVEINEEFWLSEEMRESYGDITNGAFEDTSREGFVIQPTKERVNLARKIGDIISAPEYAFTAVETYQPPFSKNVSSNAVTIFTQNLSEGEFLFIDKSLKENDFVMRTDDHRYGGTQTRGISLETINGRGGISPKFSWAFGYHLDKAINGGFIYGATDKEKETGVVRTMNPRLFRLEKLDLDSECPTYEKMKSLGFDYSRK